MRGKSADYQVAADTTGAPRRTRSLCRYPTWPKYQGGDINVAASAVCAVH
jgi:hypothetical protein